MSWFRRRRDRSVGNARVLGTTIDPRSIPARAQMLDPAGVAAIPPPHPWDAYQVTCACGAVSYHPQSCDAGKLRLSPGGALPTADVEMALRAGEHVHPADPADCYCCSGALGQGFHCKHCHAKGYCG